VLALTHEDRDWIEAHLEALYRASTEIAGADHRQVRQYIDVGEYSLALDDLADIQLKSGKPIPPDLIRLFDALATKMDIKPGDGWDAVTELRAVRWFNARTRSD
jgi:hypothetical protein